MRSLLEPNSRPRKPTTPSDMAVRPSVNFSHALASRLLSAFMEGGSCPGAGTIAKVGADRSLQVVNLSFLAEGVNMDRERVNGRRPPRFSLLVFRAAAGYREA